MSASDPQPLDHNSLTWRYFGDWRTLLLALWAGSMQNMHPELGAGVEQHSRFFEERWQRLFRRPILMPISFTRRTWIRLRQPLKRPRTSASRRLARPSARRRWPT